MADRCLLKAVGSRLSSSLLHHMLVANPSREHDVISQCRADLPNAMLKLRIPPNAIDTEDYRYLA